MGRGAASPPPPAGGTTGTFPGGSPTMPGGTSNIPSPPATSGNRRPESADPDPSAA
ncbi:hypothetical protein ABZ917_34045 [Nonomuraea wenchangensis]